MIDIDEPHCNYINWCFIILKKSLTNNNEQRNLDTMFVTSEESFRVCSFDRLVRQTFQLCTKICCYYRPQGEGSVFTGVCLTIIGLMAHRSLLGLVTVRSVCILLECFLVDIYAFTFRKNVLCSELVECRLSPALNMSHFFSK